MQKKRKPVVEIPKIRVKRRFLKDTKDYLVYERGDGSKLYVPREQCGYLDFETLKRRREE